VAKQADSNVYVTVRELSDPAGLQSRLRADGVPASVTFIDPSALPSGSALQMGAQVRGGHPLIMVSLGYASPRCTGS
jgi:hypothetical protein